MSVRSIFAKHPNRYEVLFFAAFAFSVPYNYVGSDPSENNVFIAGLAIMFFMICTAISFGCLTFPAPGGNVFIPLAKWLKRVSDITPGYYGQMKSGGGLKIIRHVFVDFQEVYDAHNGDLLGFEQEMYDEWIFTKVPPHREGEKMSPIALWRTRRIWPSVSKQIIASGSLDVLD